MIFPAIATVSTVQLYCHYPRLIHGFQGTRCINTYVMCEMGSDKQTKAEKKKPYIKAKWYSEPKPEPYAVRMENSFLTNGVMDVFPNSFSCRYLLMFFLFFF